MKDNDLVKLDFEIEKIIKRNDRFWQCTICMKTSKAEIHLKRHAETHIRRVFHIVVIFATKYCLQEML